MNPLLSLGISTGIGYLVATQIPPLNTASSYLTNLIVPSSGPSTKKVIFSLIQMLIIIGLSIGAFLLLNLIF